MKKISKYAIAALAVFASTSPVYASTHRVVDVYDGDTFTIADKPFGLTWKVRIKGIDAPEVRSRCASERYAAQGAKARLVRLFRDSGNTVTLREIEHDKYGGRLLAHVVVGNGRLASRVMIHEKHARPYNGGRKTPWCA